MSYLVSTIDIRPLDCLLPDSAGNDGMRWNRVGLTFDKFSRKTAEMI